MSMLGPGGEEISPTSIRARLSAERQAEIDAIMKHHRELDAWAAEDIRDGLSQRPLDAVKELAAYPIMPEAATD